MQRRESGIASLLGQLRQPEEPPAPAHQPGMPRETRRPRVARKAVAPSQRPAEPQAPVREEPISTSRGRVGKRSNPDYGLRGLWLRTDTYLDVTDRLRRRREYADTSELVQALLEEWLRK